MKFYYFVDKEGVRQGPLPLDDLSTYDISPTTLVWTKGMEKWLKAKDVDDFRDILQSSQVTNDILPATENPEETPKTFLTHHQSHRRTSMLMRFLQKKPKKNHLI